MPPFPEHLRHEQPLGLREAEQLALSVLCLEDRRFLVEARYLVIRLLVVYRGQVADEKVSTLTRKLGMSEAVLRKARKQLADIDGLAPSLNTSRQRGRPPLELKISLSLLARLQDAQKTPLFKQSQQEDRALQYDTEIRKLLLWVGERDPHKEGIDPKKVKAPPGESTKPCLFLYAPRLLLATFYLHASPCGEVHLSQGRLQRLTGMSLDRLDNQLANLMQLGYFDPDCPVIRGNTYGKKSGRFDSIFYLKTPAHVQVLSSLRTYRPIVNHFNEIALSKRLTGLALCSVCGKDDLDHFLQEDSNREKKLNLQKALDFYEAQLPKLVQGFKEKVFGMFNAPRDQNMPDAPLNLFGIECASIGWAGGFKFFGLHAFIQAPFGREWDPGLSNRFNDFSMAILSKGLRNYAASRVVVHEEILQDIESNFAPFYVQPILADDSSQQAIASSLQSLVTKVFSFYAYCLAYQQAGAVGAILTEALTAHKPKLLGELADGGFQVLMPPRERLSAPAYITIRLYCYFGSDSPFVIQFNNC